MKRLPLRTTLLFFFTAIAVLSAAPTDYFPPRGEWARKPPAEVGFDAAELANAVAFAQANENPSSKDVAEDLRATFGQREPNFRLLGPTQPRAAANGLIIRHGYVVAEWGDTQRTDMTHSVAKTFLSTVVGLAWQRGLIRNLDDRVGPYLPTTERERLFAPEHNAKITWQHLLRQTSDWSGTLWDVPDWADRPVGATPADYPQRARHEPGTYFKYNDVRVNLLALCALHVWRRPLPQVLREEVMDPIGASSTWRWHGYENSWVLLDGQQMQSVSGGGHFGGGMFIDAWDLARFGYLFLRHGRWAGRTIVAETWIEHARTPGPANSTYGFANWYLNTGRKPLPAAPATSVTFRGNGMNIVYLDWEHDVVAVVRWIRNDDALNGFVGKMLAALREPAHSARRPLGGDTSYCASTGAATSSLTGEAVSAASGLFALDGLTRETMTPATTIAMTSLKEGSFFMCGFGFVGEDAPAPHGSCGEARNSAGYILCRGVTIPEVVRRRLVFFLTPA
jgi:CubicO group peptidase (beta-lactamase class C family)